MGFKWIRLARLALAALLFVVSVGQVVPAGASSQGAPAQQIDPPYRLYLPITLFTAGTPSLEKIGVDWRAGKLDDFTATLYRLYALAADERLPQKYRGAAVEDRAVFARAEALLPTLPAGQQAQLRAFLVRPDHPSSAHAQFTAAKAQAAGLGAAVCWQTKVSANAAVKVKVWAVCDADAGAHIEAVLAIMNQIWGPMTALMGPPILDAGGAEQGGSTDIDIYLLPPNDEAERDGPVDVNGGRAYEYWTNRGEDDIASSGYIVVPREYFKRGRPMKPVLVHEFFHVLQDAHNSRVSFDNGKEWWFTEASAAWALVHFAPEHAAAEHNLGFTRGFQVGEHRLNLRADAASKDQMKM